MSHAQMERIDYREPAHGQRYSRSDVYGERRVGDKRQLASLSAWHKRMKPEFVEVYINYPA